MKLKAGMYVRTKDGFIDKIIIDYQGYCNSPYCDCKHISCEHNYYDEKEIEELDLGEARPNGEYIISINDKKMQDKINELVREVNKLKKEGK